MKNTMKNLIRLGSLNVGVLMSTALWAQMPPPPPSGQFQQGQYGMQQQMMYPGGQTMHPGMKMPPPPVAGTEISYDPNTGCPTDHRFNISRLTPQAFNLQLQGGIHR